MKISNTHRGLRFLLCVLMFGGLLSLYVLAQNTGTNSAPPKLNQAITLLNSGDSQGAIDLINTIPQQDSDFSAAQCYKALCFYALGNKKDFWKTLDPTNVQQALSKLDIREDVFVKQMDVFLFYGKFDSLVGKISEFETNYPSSVRLPVVQEYRLAGLVERAVKKSRDASRSKDDGQRNQHLQVASTNIQEFMSRVGAWPRTNYAALTNRSLREDVWVARLLSGDGDKALAEIPVQDVAGREKFNLLHLELNADLQRDEIDANLQRLAEFQKEFPSPINQMRVNKTAAELNFRKGRVLSLQAEAAEKAGDKQTAATNRSLASQYFGAQRLAQQIVTVNETAGITADQVLETREDFLYSFYLEKDYEHLSSLLSSMITESKPGDLNWILAKLYTGIYLASQEPAQNDAAGKAFDEVLASGFKEEHHNDRLLTEAAKWRFHLYIQSSNYSQARELVRSVVNSQCRRDYRVAFSNQFSTVLSVP
jgi:hypothetical protein